MIINIQSVADIVCWQVKSSLHQFDYCLSLVKIDVTTEQQLFLAILKLSGEFFIFWQAHRVHETISFLARTSPYVDRFKKFFHSAVNLLFSGH